MRSRNSDDAPGRRRGHASWCGCAFAPARFPLSRAPRAYRLLAAGRASGEASGRGDADPARSSLPGEADRPGLVTVPPEAPGVRRGGSRPAQPCSLPDGPRLGSSAPSTPWA
jgi:hypothetical protein